MNGVVSMGASAAVAVTALAVGWALGVLTVMSWIARRGGPYQEGYQQGFDDGLWRVRKRAAARASAGDAWRWWRWRDPTGGGGSWLT